MSGVDEGEIGSVPSPIPDNDLDDVDGR
ncbi:hypothetical protein SEA_ZAGIE_44 [Microbacterium phage Zagie]|uniref:Uncharacterized protein n=2 Tax=Squashvirus TaxID=2733215 RepID=A0A2U8UJ90_9CAUD|nr:hypothetical protein HOT27_gp044 [Microbacterium phage Hyperion]YP_009801786.1 hypothetical protein HOT29_gp047 [Microbacterium phage Squash]QIQ63689.1 hypothetical protein SEA_NIKE_45 [Microbacterium phage Nike]UVG33888.1 hypothetical protein SEA_VICEROY_43 [Microbacterium phage Viceroy]UVG33995.1 hypothetical protein SEA_WHEELIE_44 [Microbacterium phage Wheelie]UVG34412.1 hypothetical protein SEA_GAZEBO_43 [Microbacterium phage Gazebo]UVG35397.1 hypothetical protein SEA_ZAGIE_44 [Microba